MPDKTYDITITEDAERFAFNVNKYVIGREITALIVRPDRVEILLDSGQTIAFKIDGPDIAIHVPGGPSSESVPGLGQEPGGMVQ